MNDEVVDVYCNEVDIDGVVFFMVKSDMEFGFDIVSFRNEDWVFVVGFGKVECIVEFVNVRVGIRLLSGFDDGFDSFDEIVIGIDGNVGSGVSEVFGFGGGFGGESMVSNVLMEGLVLEGDLRDVRVGEVDGGVEGRG